MPNLNPAAARAPLVPPEVDLRNMPWMPLEVDRLLKSDIMRNGSGEEIRAALILWCRSWHEIPASSLPNDEKMISHWVMLSPGKWRGVREKVLRGFVLCSDGRLYHEVIAVKALEAFEMKRRQSDRAKGRNKNQLNLGAVDESVAPAAAGPGLSNANVPVFVPPLWVPVEAWKGYVAMRKANRRPMTDRAMELALRDLLALKNAGHDPEVVLDQSVKRGWLGLFEPKSESPGRAAATSGAVGSADAIRAFVAGGRK